MAASAAADPKDPLPPWLQCTEESFTSGEADSRRDRKDNTKLETLFDEERVLLEGGEGKGGGGSVPVILLENYDDGEMRRREGKGGVNGRRRC
ncbi:hypothetical protein CDL15_Pgr014575 [Punica granatum]|uniref:Uncharacterized protein n=1 Tax=Punica granatum TaxID=22663 RepID=A0A218WFR4_PUNGR|nr:hypothetical protein CDL15_Pgr014575 [Punica granatum]